MNLLLFALTLSLFHLVSVNSHCLSLQVFISYSWEVHFHMGGKKKRSHKSKQIHLNADVAILRLLLWQFGKGCAYCETHLLRREASMDEQRQEEDGILTHAACLVGKGEGGRKLCPSCSLYCTHQDINGAWVTEITDCVWGWEDENEMGFGFSWLFKQKLAQTVEKCKFTREHLLFESVSVHSELLVAQPFM